MLDAQYIIEAERRARRFSGAWTGTSGTLAADVIRLLKERVQLMNELEAANKALRDAVAARLAATPTDDPKLAGYSPMAASLAGCKPAQEAAAVCLACPPARKHADTLGYSPEFLASTKRQIDELAAAQRRAERVTLIGFAGNIGSGKSAAAAMLPGTIHIQWADAIYRGLATMFDVPEEVLRDREAKEQPIDIGGMEIVPRHCARTLGTEWGRDCIGPRLWVTLTMLRIRKIERVTGRKVFSVCGTRFPNEVAVCDEVWWVDRPGTEAGNHKSDTSLAREQCDRIIVNDGSIEKLRHNVEAAWKDFLESKAAA